LEGSRSEGRIRKQAGHALRNDAQTVTRSRPAAGPGPWPADPLTKGNYVVRPVSYNYIIPAPCHSKDRRLATCAGCPGVASCLFTGCYQILLASNPPNDQFHEHRVVGREIVAAHLPVRDYFEAGEPLSEAVVGLRRKTSSDLPAALRSADRRPGLLV